MARRFLVLVASPWLWASAAHASISVTIRAPIAGTYCDTPLAVKAQVSSTYQLQSVVASVGANSAPLTYGQICDPYCWSGWTGSLSLLGLSRGAQTLTVMATDVYGGTGQAQIGIIYDQLPKVTVVEPHMNAVARPRLHVSATCTDDGPAGCVSLIARTDGADLASGVSSIETDLDLSAIDGQGFYLHLDGTDSTGRRTRVDRWVMVEGSTALGDVIALGDWIVDAQPDKVLWHDDVGNTLAIRTLSSEISETIPVPVAPSPSAPIGHVTPRGAILFSTPGGDVWEWRDSAALHLDPVANEQLLVKGSFAMWFSVNIDRYDLDVGVSVVIPPPASANSFVNIHNDLSPQGDVVFSAYVPVPPASYDYHVFRWHAGSSTQITSGTGVWNVYPQTDGTNIVFRRRTLSPSAESLVLYDGANEIILDPNFGHEPPGGYQVVNGWVAFTRRSTVDGTTQVFLRSPAGTEEQVSFFGTSSGIDALSADGRVTFVNGNHTYLKLPGQPARQIAWRFGQSFWVGTTGYIKIGQALLRIEGSGVTGPSGFYTATPCRVLDTRDPDGPLGGPALAPRSRRVFTVAGACGIPPTAKAISANITVTQGTAPGDLRFSPAAELTSPTSTVNYNTAQTRGNNAILTLDANGQIAVQCDAYGTVQLVLDMNGWFE